jgi:hypothetical protein
MQPIRFASGRIALTCALALGTGLACNGGVDVAPPSAASTESPPSSNLFEPAEQTESRPRPIAPQPVGPYTGLVGTTDVSILYPLPLVGESKDFVRPSEVGNYGALLPQSFVTTVLDGQDRLERTRDLPSGYQDLSLVAVRLDPCRAARGAHEYSCKSEVRAIFQALYDKPAGAENDPIAGTAATDGAIHVMYDVDGSELMTMMKEILTLKQANGNQSLLELAPHPILAAQGLGGGFAQGLRNILLSHLGEDRIRRITMFDHNLKPEMDAWTFVVFDRVGTTFVQGDIPTTEGVQFQTITGTPTDAPLVESSAELRLGLFADEVQPLVSGGRPGPGTPAAAALQPTFDAALRVQNPTIHNAETTNCGNCHVAESARRIGESIYGLDTANAFTHPRSLAYVNENPTATNLHAFGYLHRKVSVMQRTANESVLIASAMEASVK